MSVVGAFFGVLIVAVALLYRWVCRHNDFFRTHGVPFSKPLPLFGNMFRVFFRKSTMAEALQKAYDSNKEAKYVGFLDCMTPVVIVRDLELAKQITIDQFEQFSDHRWIPETFGFPYLRRSIIALNGDEWRDMRALLSPLFSLGSAKAMFHRVSRCAASLSDFMAYEVLPGEDVISNDLFRKYTLGVIAELAFGVAVNTLRDQNNKFIKMSRTFTRLSISRMLRFLLVKDVPQLEKWLKMWTFNEDEVKFFARIVANEMARPQRDGVAGPNVIRSLMQARSNGEKLDTDDITAQAFIVFLAGLDGPARTLKHAALEIALNKDVQMKLQQEIDQVLTRCGGRVSYEALNDMKYLDAVISEVLRLYPITCAIHRTCPVATELPPALPGLRPLPVHKGMDIWVPLFCIHRDPRYFPDPDRFDPDRFLGDNRSKILPYSYFPFGLGPRSCPAVKFALMALKLPIFHVLAKFNLFTAPRSEDPVEKCSNPVFALPERSHSLTVVKRCKSHRNETFRVR